MVDDAATLLQQLGFGDYEARAYVALLQRSPLNGYELAKSSGIPRANIYAVLQKLEERNAVVRLDTPTGSRYGLRSFESPMLGWAFSLYALAEIVYMTYHLDWTVFLFAHTIAEVLDLVAFVLVFAAATQQVLGRRGTAARGQR